MSQYDHLPEIARELITLIGYDSTILLMQQCGGTYLDVPQDPQKASVLQGFLPYPAVVKLCAHYHGDRIPYVPKIDSALRKARDAEIRATFGTVGVRHLARQHKLSIVRIYQIIAAQEQERQTSLFE